MQGRLQITVIAILVVLCKTLQAQNIPDLNFRQAIAAQCATCIDGNGDLTLDAQQLSVLDVDGNNIASVEGIEGFVALTEFYCADNELTSIPTLPDSIKIFHCSDNMITALPSSLPQKLQELKCDNNQLTSLPDLPNKLTQLFCSGNNLTTLPSLPAFLDNLTCNDNQLTALPSLPALLTSLHCITNHISELPELPSSLQKLYCSENELTSLPELPSSITVMDVSVNPISCLPLLPQGLQNMNVDFTYVSCLPNIPIAFQSNSPLPLCVNDSSVCTITPKVSGMAFIDYDGNGVKNGIDVPVSGMKVFADPGSWQGITDSTGNYTMSVGFNNTFTVNPEIPAGTYTITTAPGSFVTDDTTNQQFLNGNFGLQPAGDNYDLATTVCAGSALPSAPVVYTINYRNNSAFSILGTIQLVFDPNLTFVSSDVATSSQIGLTLAWDFPSMAPFTSRIINVVFNVAGSANPGDTLTSSVTSSISGEIDLAPGNNSQVIKNVVVSSASSNEMIVSDDTITPYQVAAGKFLDYTLNFQNPGISTTNHLEVFDTISHFLNADSLQMIGASHSYSLEISNADFDADHPMVLHWTFDNVQLPSSNADDLKSRGLIHFRVKVGDNATQDVLITNKAKMIFDNVSVPVYSNSVSTHVLYPVGVEGFSDEQSPLIFPNPFTDVVYITHSTLPALLEVCDLTGKVIKTVSFDAGTNSLLKLNLGQLSSGSYLLKIKSGVAVSSVLMIKE